MTKPVMAECLECGKWFDKSLVGRYKYCSAECAKAAQVRQILEYQNTAPYKQYRKRYYKRTADEHIDRAKKWQTENREHYDEYQRQYYMDNKEKLVGYSREWRLKNSERYKQWQRTYRKLSYARNKLDG
ncbi:MAG: hypothetical protein OXC80_07275 [Gammaproteobacteria bacterium]|nr:hypothetical protein [Gammaproteobacteria bacterium]